MNVTPVSYVRLLRSARQWYEDGYYSEAVILLQTSAELFAEQVFTALCRRRDLEYLRPQLERLLFNNYNLAQDKVSSLYQALAEDDLKQQPFWSRYKAHNELRNDIVHDGRAATKLECEQSLRAVTDLIDHLKTVSG
jgi:hypothetical protein